MVTFVRAGQGVSVKSALKSLRYCEKKKKTIFFFKINFTTSKKFHFLVQSITVREVVRELLSKFNFSFVKKPQN